MNNYTIQAYLVEETGKSARCIDPRCDGPCGSCDVDGVRKDGETDPFSVIDCENDVLGNDEPDKATTLTLGEEKISASICPNQEDWYTVTAPANRKVRIEVHWNNNENRYNPETRLYDGNLQPALNVEAMNGGPMPQFGKTVLTSVRLGDLMVAGLPGEAASFIGVQTYQAIKEAVKDSGTFNEVLILGYTNDHHFYIVTETDWFQGDYEPSMSIWGYKFGAFLLENLKDMALMFASGDYSGIDEFPNTKPLKWDGLPDDTRTPLKTAKPTQDSFVYTSPSPVALTQQVVVKWIGGDPGAEMTPKAVLEKKVGDEWKEVAYPSGDVYDPENHPEHRLYTDRSYEMQLDYSNESFFLTGISNPDTNNYWSYTWEERRDFPAGTYRLHIYGHYYDGSADTYERDKVLEYDIASDPIEIVPAILTVQNPEFSYNICDASKRRLAGEIRFQMPAVDGDPEDFSDNGDNLTNRFTTAKSHSIVLHTTEHERWLPPAAEDGTLVSVSVTKEGDAVAMYTRTDVPVTLGTGTAHYTNSRRSATEDDTGVIVVLDNDSEMVETYAAANSRPTATFEFTESDTEPLPELGPGTYHVTVDVRDGDGREGHRTYKVILPEPTQEQLDACQQ